MQELRLLQEKDLESISNLCILCKDKYSYI